MRRIALLLVMLFAAAVLTAPSAAAAGRDVVRTHLGVVRGTVGETSREFQGIPFAAPPIGERRWRSPAPASRWRGVRDATKPAPECAQLPVFGPGSTSEDCLYLNVTTPLRPARKRPVMLWIHGGGYVFGSGTQYSARRLAVQGDVVVVTVNYRLGVFGFLAHPGLNDGWPVSRSGNFAIEDQQAALRWIRRNAAAFGGDPHNVTIFGQSAGGRSVCAQLVSPLVKGLFDRAIVQSEPCTQALWPAADGSPDDAPPGVPRPRAEAERQGVEVAQELGCETTACLRALPAGELLERTAAHHFGPAFGGDLVVPVDPARAASYADVPVLHGITRDEYRFSEAFRQPPLTADAYPDAVRRWVGADDVDAVLRAYPLADYDSPAEAYAAVLTDSSWARAHSDLNRALARRVPTYAYQFADRDAPWLDGFSPAGFDTGAFHTAELQYLFDVAGFPGPHTADQRGLSDRLIAYWSRFARTGNPNGAGLPHWARAGRAATQALNLAPDGSTMTAFDRTHNVDLWRSIHP